jgi:threonine/homoserine efflux transporter RhtA
MQTELFVHFAEIAGVFVGFGALISLRSARPTDVHDVVYLTTVLMLGLWVVIAALVPIAVSRYGVHDRTLWLSSALAALAIWVALLIAIERRPEFRVLNRNPEPLDRFFPLVGLPLHLVIAGCLILIIVGIWRHVDEALYVTALAAGVVFAGYTLLTFVVSQKHQAGQDGDGA